MREAVESAQSQLLIAIFPTKNTVYRELMSQSSPPPPESYFLYLDAEQKLTRSIEEFLSNHQINYVNTTTAIQDRLASNVPTHPESDDGHPNKNGYAAIAEAIMSYMNNRQL
jgi:lysophospholipase L1-like esterase